MDLPTASSNRYLVEVSGWDASENFFVEKTVLEWGDALHREITLRSGVHEGCVLFVQLLQTHGMRDTFPIAHRASKIVGKEPNGRIRVCLTQLHPRAPFKGTPRTLGRSTNKVA